MKNAILILILIGMEVFAQCGCMNGASASNFSPVSETSQDFVTEKGDLLLNTYFKYGYGDEYYRGDIQIPADILKEYSTFYTGLYAKYGISNSLNVEMDLGYYPLKKQVFSYANYESAGLSHILSLINYSIFSEENMQYEFGAGVLLPLGKIPEESLPQHLLTSGGSYAAVLNSTFKYRHQNSGLNFFVVNRGFINFLARDDYLYGNTLINALIVTKKLNPINLLLEVRNELRSKDEYLNEKLPDTGNILFYASPKIDYSVNDFTVRIASDIPFYEYYNGEQLSNNYSLTFSLFWNTNIGGI